MTRCHHNPTARLVLSLSLFALFALSAAASAEHPDGWRLRLYAATVDLESGPARIDRTGFTRFAVDAAGGVGLNAEYRFSRRLGVDFGIFTGGGAEVQAATFCGTFCAGSGWAGFDTLTFHPLMTGLDIHLTPEQRVDLYAGPLVAWVRYGDIEVQTGAGPTLMRIEFDQQLAGGVMLGVGVPFGGSRWTFDGQLIYLDSALDGRGRDGYRMERSYDTTIFGFGFGYRFSRWTRG